MLFNYHERKLIMSTSVAVAKPIIVDVVPQENTSESLTISQAAAEAFKNFLAKNKEYLKQSAGVFHTDNHSNW